MTKKRMKRKKSLVREEKERVEKKKMRRMEGRMNG